MPEKRLLIIDDEPELVKIVRRAAIGAGYDVQVTTTEKGFKEAVEEFDPTLIVVDIVMPDVDGIELVNWLAENKATSKIVVATGFNPHYAKMAETIGGAQGLNIRRLDKPFRLADLRALLNEA